MLSKKSFLILWLIIMVAGICGTAGAKAVVEKEATKNKIVLEYDFNEPIITKAGEYDSVQIKGLETYEQIGAPIVPVQPVKVLVPFGKKVASCKVTELGTKELSGTYLLAPAQKPYPISYEGPREPTKPDPAVYGQAKPWLGKYHEQLSTQSKKGYQFFIANLFPLQYVPKTGKISYASKLRVEISLADAKSSSALRPTKSLKSDLQKKADNPSALASYPESGASLKTSGKSLTLQSNTLQMFTQSSNLPAGTYEYVIITSADLNDSNQDPNFKTLRDAKIAKGITATIVTTDWIYANYDGSRPDGNEDNQTRIHNFLVDAYQNWDTQYVLLGGANSIIPARYFYVNVVSLDEKSIPTDMYYGLVDQPDCNFDFDADGLYGEPNDGIGGGEVDLVMDIYVGRAAVEDTNEIANFVRKTLTYDATDVRTDEYLKRVVMAADGGFRSIAELIRLGGGDSTIMGFTIFGFEDNNDPAFIDFNTIGCLPDDTNSCWPLYVVEPNFWGSEELIPLINDGVHILHHEGHGGYNGIRGLHTSYLSLLTNDNYFFIYSGYACHPGGFDQPDCLAEVITTMEHGAFAVIMNSRYGGNTGEFFAMRFWDTVLGERILGIGKANQESKEYFLNQVISDLSGCARYCYYELNLFGDPQQELKIKGPYLDFVIEDDVNDGNCVVPGDEVTYTISYGNPVTDPNDPLYAGIVTDVDIIDYLPEDVNRDSVIPSDPNAVYDPNTNSITWRIGTLYPGEANFVAVSVEITNTAAPFSTIKNYAMVTCNFRTAHATVDTSICYWDSPIIYVDPNATGSNTGTTWQDAYTDIYDAFVKASSGGSHEIWVASGTYHQALTLIDGVSLYGHFAGNETSIEQRDFNNPNNETILRCDYCYDVITAANIVHETTLDGLTVTNGGTNGIKLTDANLVIKNCLITDNPSNGIYAGGLSFKIIDCNIQNNSGSGVKVTDGTLAVQDCLITNNSGRGVEVAGGDLTVQNCLITANGNSGVEVTGGTLAIQNCLISDSGFGGIYAYNSNFTVTDCNIQNNSFAIISLLDSTGILPTSQIVNNIIHNNGGLNVGAVYVGLINPPDEYPLLIANNWIYNNYGGIEFEILQDYDITIQNNTIVNNESFGIGAPNGTSGYPSVSNCILWNNGDELGDGFGATYSCIEDGDVGTGNISSDPCFVDADNNDFHINIYSPCINAGNCSGDYNDQNDIDGQMRVIGRCVDMGADEVYFNTPEPNGHWWKLDETSGVTAYDSVDDNDGTFNGDEPNWVTGHIGGAADFNGASDYFSVSDLNSAYTSSSNFTVAGWFKTSQSAGIQTIVGSWGQWYQNPAPGVYLHFYAGWQVLVENNKVKARFGSGSPTTPYDITGTKDVNDCNWHHFALVHPGYGPPTNSVLYVDGQQDATPAGYVFSTSYTKFRIGDGSYVNSGSPTLKGGPFCGTIDDVMIFNRALTADEVEQLYLAGQ